MEATTRAFERLVREHQVPLLRHVRMVYPRVHAESVVNATFVAAWQRMADIDPPAAHAWLRATARFVVHNTVRQARRFDALAARAAQLDPGPSHVDSPDTAARAELDVVLRALETLSDPDRELLVMCALESPTAEEIGVILGIRPATARVRLSRARARLREAVAAHDVEPGEGEATAPFAGEHEEGSR